MSLEALRREIDLECERTLKADKEENELPCLIFRGYRRFTYVARTCCTELHQSVILLRRKSCSGCEDCNWFRSTIKKLAKEGRVIMPVIRHGQLYTVRRAKLKKYIEFIPYHEGE